MDQIKTKNKFLDEYKKKHDTTQTDKDSLVAKEQKVGQILEGIVSFPEKVHLVGPIGKTSVRPSKKDEMPGNKESEFSSR